MTSLLVAFAISSTLVFAQTKTVTGTVVDELGEPVIGANVVVAGTTNGATTDIDGNFSIQNVANNATLRVTYIGYREQNIPVAGKNRFNIKIEEDRDELDEVVVIGYGTVKKRDLTGSVSSVNAKELVANPVSDVAQALQGKLAGVSVVSQDGRPGGETSIRVRGGGSISQSNEPLIIVDGFPAGSISEIPADQIVSIDVLKDAASTAIYGARGANGVILVTTKGADKDKLTISYSGFMQVKKVFKTTEALDAQDYLRYVWSYGDSYGSGLADGIAKYYGLGALGGNHWDQYDDIEAHDWTDDLLRTATQWNHNVSLAGGSEKTKYTLSLGYTDDEGTKIRSGYERYSVNFKLKQKINKRLTFDMDLRYTNVHVTGRENYSTGRGTALSSAFEFRPIDNPLGDGIVSYFGLGANNFEKDNNPLYALEHMYNGWTFNRLRGNFALSYEIIKGLTLRSELALGGRWRVAKYYEDSDHTTDFTKGYKYATLNKSESQDLRSVTTLNYDIPGLGENHSLNVMLGNEEIKNKSENSYMVGAGYPTDDIWDMDRVFGMMSMGDSEARPNENYYTNTLNVPETTTSWFGRINYSLFGRYLFTATFRADGSSKFGPNNHWGYFPAAAVAWRISDESIFENTREWLDNLKLRLSWGESGADNINSSLWRETWSTSTTSWNGGTVNVYAPQGMKSNPDLKWETTISRNIGLDFGFLNRINGTFDLYWNTTKDLLMRDEIDSSTGYSYQMKNMGQTSNKGFEIGVNALLVHSKNFNLNFAMTYNFNNNNVDELPNHTNIYYGSGIFGSGQMPGNDFMLAEDKPVGVVQGFKVEGVGFYTVDDFDIVNGQYVLKQGIPDISTAITGTCNPNTGFPRPDGQTAFPGMIRLQDVDGSGVVDNADVSDIGEIMAMSSQYNGKILHLTYLYTER
jgi:TonB-linked SusC/RagA family outer membrane protein